MVDDLIEYSQNDPELAEGLKWLDKTNKFSSDINFYERVFRCLQKYDAEEKAKEWLTHQK